MFFFSVFQCRVFGRLVLIPFLEGRCSPGGLDAQQRAEVQSEEIFSRASSAIGMLVGLSEQMNFLLRQRSREISAELERCIPELDDCCIKNYSILICLTEKVKNLQKFYFNNFLRTLRRSSIQLIVHKTIFIHDRVFILCIQMALFIMHRLMIIYYAYIRLWSLRPCDWWEFLWLFSRWLNKQKLMAWGQNWQSPPLKRRYFPVSRSTKWNLIAQVLTKCVSSYKIPIQQVRLDLMITCFNIKTLQAFGLSSTFCKLNI